MSKQEEKTSESRRGFIKKAAYIAPVVMTMAVVPTVHAVGSASGSPNNGSTGGISG